jgi:hypothetical protein
MRSQMGYDRQDRNESANDSDEGTFLAMLLQRVHSRERITRTIPARISFSGNRSDRGAVQFGGHDRILGRNLIGHGAGLIEKAERLSRATVGELLSGYLTLADQARSEFRSAAPLTGGATQYHGGFRSSQ